MNWKSLVPGFLGVNEDFQKIWVKVDSSTSLASGSSSSEEPFLYCRAVETSELDNPIKWICYPTVADAHSKPPQNGVPYADRPTNSIQV